MKKQILLSTALLISSVALADTIQFDSAALANKIVNTTNAVITAIPTSNPIVEGVKIFFIAIGSAITGWSIHYFKKKNSK